MTSKEAIKALKEIKTYVSAKHLEAVDYAIFKLGKMAEAEQALREEPKGEEK